MELLRKKYGGFYEVKNRLNPPAHSEVPYRSVFCIFEYKGVLAEVQFIPSTGDGIDAVMKKKCHTLYEIVRQPNGAFIALFSKRDSAISWFD